MKNRKLKGNESRYCYFNPTLLVGTTTILLLSNSHAPKFRWVARENWNGWVSCGVTYP